MKGPRIILRRPLLEAGGSLLRLARAAIWVAMRRTILGPRRPGWTFSLEVATNFFRWQGRRAFYLAGDGAGMARARVMIDTLTFRMPALERVRITAIRDAPISGRWFDSGRAGPVALHFHGGGYVFAPATTDNLIAALTLAVGGRTFVPEYRLAPEYPFPSQIEDALRCYAWLGARHAHDGALVLTGDSAGGHLALALLLTLDQRKLTLPAATVVISPWTDPRCARASMRTNAAFDWMSADMSARMAAWATGGAAVESAHLRLTQADLSRLRRVLIHAGGAEISRDMVRDFCANASACGADVRCVFWPDMIHNFHGFGELAPSSQAALEEIAACTAPPPVSADD